MKTSLSKLCGVVMAIAVVSMVAGSAFGQGQVYDLSQGTVSQGGITLSNGNLTIQYTGVLDIWNNEAVISGETSSIKPAVARTLLATPG